jgi:hypothetical protein
VAATKVPELEGRTLDTVDGSAAPYWIFRLSGGARIAVGCEWRLVHDGRIVLAGGDHHQLFGLQEPVDAVVATERLLKSRQIISASLGEVGDLTLLFDGGPRLETFTDSMGYESCTIHLDDGREPIVVGGGAVREV